MNKEEIKEYLNRVEKLELKLDGEDKETLQLLIYGYNQCAKLLNETEQQCQKQRKVINKARKMIFDNYGILDKYEIELLDDILKEVE